MSEIIFSGEFASLAGIPEDALKAQLTTEAGELKPEAAKIFSSLVLNKFKRQEQERKDQQYHRGYREAKEAAEEAVRPLFQKFGVSASRFEDAVRELSEKLGDGSVPKGAPHDMTPQELAKLPAFKAALEEHTNAIVEKWKTKEEAARHEYETFRKQVQQKEVAQAVFSNTRAILEKDGRQPIYGTKGPDDAIRMFWAYHGTDQIKLEDGKPVLLDKEGNVLRDEMSNPVDFSKFVESNWLLGFKEAAGTGSPPHNGRSGSNAPIRGIEDFKARIAAAKTPQERAEILAAQAEAMRKAEK